MEEMLDHASGLLSELTSCTAVVVGPSHDSATVKSVQLVGIGPRVAVLVVVLSDGAVEKRTIELDGEATDGELSAVAAGLAAQLQGHALAGADPAVGTGDPQLDAVTAQVATVLRAIGDRDDSEHVFVGGPSRLAGSFDAVETVRQVLSILEQQLVVVSLLRDVLDRGLSVAIGTEHGFEPLASCAVVVSPVSVDGTEVGAVGLLGPTRMDYPQAMAAAHMIGTGLGERLSGPPERAQTKAKGGRRGRK